ncbi:MAG: thioredoxin domain-containing protein [Gammaproteobacteria bacterium]|nr:thioredoxin domain-containing protein [Gammaproteobacteria bacterium]
MSNHLANEASPYLKQHAENPVEWYPWGEEAFEKARQENKPILLSIGYAACHWCHVMAHESFEDVETAQLMNKLFVNIKVDREERPDLDKVFLTAHYLLTRSGGGWPLTVFLTPQDQVPFFSGTYFPPEPRFQLPAFKDILKRVAQAYQENPSALQKQNNELVNFLNKAEHAIPVNLLNDEPLLLAEQTMQQQFDKINGGFGVAPKFPQPTRLAFLIQRHSPMAYDTMCHMGKGGIVDQLGGGFFRYTVDEAWRIPHFEKMLYDNGQLLYLYSQSKDVDFNNIARAVAYWLENNMQDPAGGYYSSMNADSEGEEGKFYLWHKQTLESLLNAEEFALIERYFGLLHPPLCEGQWHLYLAESLEAVASQLKINLNDAKEILFSATQKMMVTRALRIAPSIDKKILTAWNALTIKGMLTAGKVLNESRFTQSALRALDFIYAQVKPDKKLFACYKDGRGYLTGYLDDYSFLIDALLVALQINWRNDYLYFAIDLADILLNDFYDHDQGGFFFTAHQHEKLLYRPKTMMDEAIPSGNGVAAQVLLTLGHLLGNTQYLLAAEKTLYAASSALLQHPTEHCSLLLALQAYLKPPSIIILRGKESELNHWKNKLKTNDNIVLAIPSDITALPQALAMKKARDQVTAYVCKGEQCQEVSDNLENLNVSSPLEK